MSSFFILHMSCFCTVLRLDFIVVLVISSYADGQRDFEKVLELKPGHSTAEKELSQIQQSKDTLDLALSSFENGDTAKAQEYLDKVVLVLSPYCSKVTDQFREEMDFDFHIHNM